MAKVVRLVIEDDPDEVSVVIESATHERAGELAEKILIPIIELLGQGREMKYPHDGS